MEKSKFEPYNSEDELVNNAPNIVKAWKKEKREDCLFCMRHIEDDPNNPDNCLFIGLNKNGKVFLGNEAQWTKHMLMNKHVNPRDLQMYGSKLLQEFSLLAEMERDRLKQIVAQKEKAKMKEAEHQAELTAMFMTMAMNQKSKYKN